MTHIQRTCKTRRGMIVLAVAVLALLMGAVVLPRTGAKAAFEGGVGGGSTSKTIYDQNRTVTVTPDNGTPFTVSVHCTLTEITFNLSITYSATVSADLSGYKDYRAFKLSNSSFSVSSMDGSELMDMKTFSSTTDERIFDGLQITCEYIVTLVPLPEPPTKEGYTFTGWYTDEACTNKYVGEMVRDDMTLYAGWQINRYTVTYDSAGGTYCESATVDWNTSPTLPTPTRTGYTFVGWFDGETQYTDAPVKANKNLVAHWEIMTFTVTFMSDGTVYKTITVDYGTSLVEAMETAEIAAYAAYSDEGVRLGKQNSVITENTQILVQDLSGWEKYGDFVGRNQWYTWLTAGALGALAVTTVVMAIVIKKRG